MERMRLAGGGGAQAYNTTIDRDDDVRVILFCVLLYSNSICNTLN